MGHRLMGAVPMLALPATGKRNPYFLGSHLPLLAAIQPSDLDDRAWLCRN
jgi:hypothetical protein